MCGVLAEYNPAALVDAARLRMALGTLRRRGPDGEGVWASPCGRVALGHTRLAVIDPDNSPQPIAGPDGESQLAVNGEFYDHEAIRRDLARRGRRFRTGGDSEIALHLYEEHGPAFLHQLRGEFALVLWDAKRRLLLAARDRFGVKPLCWTLAGGRLLVASEAKALFALGAPAGWDEEAVFAACGMQYTPPDRTLFAGVHLLPPGCFLRAHDGRVEVCRYWAMDYPPEGEKSPAPLAEQAAGLRERLDEAVRLRLRADAPVCFHLSGGLDSTGVTALASARLGRPVACFTVGFDAPGYDELAQAQDAARCLGAELHAVRLGRGEMLAHLSDAVYCSEGLAINGHLPAKYLLARAIRRAGFRVVLSGEGADELLGGYAHFRQDLLHGAGPAPLEQLRAGNGIMAGIHLPEGDGLPLDAVTAALGFAPAFLQAKATFGWRMRRLLRDDFLRRFSGRDCYADFLTHFDLGRLRNRHPVDVSSCLWSASSMATYILRTLGDGTEAAHGVEGRLPFLDHVFFEHARTLPTNLKIRDGVEKFVLREALAGVLPAAVRRRAKHPFTAPPLCAGDPAAAGDLVQQMLRGPGLAHSPFFDPEKVVALLDRLPALPGRERVATDPVLMLVLTACLAQERFGL
jgi:asparagine synthase (glutamine-hydrolysing)